MIELPCPVCNEPVPIDSPSDCGLVVCTTCDELLDLERDGGKWRLVAWSPLEKGKTEEAAVDPVRFSLGLVEASAVADRCPHLGVDSAGPFCRATADQGMPAARSACEYASLQLWCLEGASRWPICAFHPESVAGAVPEVPVKD